MQNKPRRSPVSERSKCTHPASACLPPRLTGTASSPPSAIGQGLWLCSSVQPSSHLGAWRGLSVGQGHPVNMKGCQQGREEPLLTFGGGFPIQSVPVSSFQLVSSRGRKDGGEQETQQQLSKPRCVGTGGWCFPVTDTLGLKPFLN